MGEVSLRDWLALLGEAGVRFSSVAGLRAAVEAAAERLDLKLDYRDLTSLSDLEDMLSPSRAPNRDPSRMVVCHIQQLEDVPSAPVPEGDDDDHKRPYARVLTALPALPPWGTMETKLEGLRTRAIVPIHWTPAEGLPVTKKKWNAFLTGLVDGIDSMLWPKYAKEGNAWGSPSVAKLLDADFQLLATLNWQLGMPIKALFPTKVVHNDMFTDEDDRNIALGTGYDRYDPTVPKVVLNGLPTVLIAGIADKVGTLDLQLKQIFQRPRAYQVAFLQGRDNFNYLWARTGNTPSLVSGHCLQAVIGGCTAYAAYRDVLSSSSIEVLQQFTVDVGDRRVFAGVHYPSDNLASWYVALNLVPLVFDGEHGVAARHFLWAAISERSKVFKAVKGYKDSEGNSPYTKILAEIERLGSADR